jgi:hypothetical protein
MADVNVYGVVDQGAGTAAGEPTTFAARFYPGSPSTTVDVGAQIGPVGLPGAFTFVEVVDGVLHFLGSPELDAVDFGSYDLHWLGDLTGIVTMTAYVGDTGTGVPTYHDPGDPPAPPPPPVGPTWATPAQVAAVLNLRSPDTDRLQRNLSTAQVLIVRALDRPATAPALPDPPPPELVQAEVQVAARLYVAEGNPLGVVSTATDTVHYGADPLAGVYPLLAGWSYNRGVR